MRIVNHGTLEGNRPQFEIAARPIYRVGWAAGDRPFENVVAAALFDDGGAVIADGGSTQELVVLSRQGVITSVLGGRGEGPTEFQQLHSVWTVGMDTILADDSRAQRLTVLDRSGVLKTLALSNWGSPSVLGGSADGTIFLGPPLLVVFGRRYPTPWKAVPLLTLDLETMSTDSIGAADWDQSLVFGGHDPFASRGFAVASAAGFVTGRADVAELRWRDSSGALTQIVRWVPEVEHVSGASWSRVDSLFRATLPEGTPREVADLMVSDMEAAHQGTVPLFGGLVRDPAGRVWLREYRNRYMPPNIDGATYDVFAPSGEHLGALTLPSVGKSELLAVGTDRILTVERDEFDVEAIVAYPLIH